MFVVWALRGGWGTSQLVWTHWEVKPKSWNEHVHQQWLIGDKNGNECLRILTYLYQTHLVPFYSSL